QTTPIANQGAELFGLKENDLSKEDFEKRLTAIGLQPYPSYKKGVATYRLGPEGILGVRQLAIQFNGDDYQKKA
ncbi:uridine kinase, partial [Marinomonas arenicola]